MKNRMTKYECSNILGIRVNQLNDSAPIMTHIADKHKSNNFYIAAKELYDKALNINICRPLAEGKYYKINIQNLELPEDLKILLDMIEEQT